MWNYNNVIIIFPGYKPLYAKGWTASKTTNIESHIPTTPITCLPFSFPFLAPSVISGHLILTIYSHDMERTPVYISR